MFERGYSSICHKKYLYEIKRAQTMLKANLNSMFLTYTINLKHTHSTIQPLASSKFTNTQVTFVNFEIVLI